MTNDVEVLRMALVGYQAEAQKIEEKIAELQAKLSGKTAASPAPAKTGKRKRRTMSAAGKARIREALKKRWAEYHKKKGTS